MSPGGRASKSRGNSFEYRIRNWFVNRSWESERNPLSGASTQIMDAMSKHDVRAKKDGIFLQIECKKTGHGTKHKLQRRWFDKIDFNNDELLVFAFGNSPIYAIVPQETYRILDSSFVFDAPRYIAEGEQYFTFERAWLDAEDPVCFLWKDYNTIYVATLLEKFEGLILKRGPLESLNPEDVIKATNDVKELVSWYKIHGHRLTHKEKWLYHGKMHRLENGIDEIPSKEFIAQAQWWRDTTQDVVMKCPHCNNLITHGDLQKNKESDDKVS